MQEPPELLFQELLALSQELLAHLVPELEPELALVPELRASSALQPSCSQT